MKQSKIISIFCLTLLILNSCKKKDEPEPEPAPIIPSDTYNPPPAGGGFYMVNNGLNGLSWTKDFITFTKYSSKIASSSCIGFSGDTVLIHTTDKVSFGNVYNPADFKSVSCSKTPSSISWINGVIVCYATDNSGKYLGSCNFKNGESSVTFTLQPTNIYFGTLYNVGHAVVSSGSENGNIILATTTNGRSWWYRSVPSSFPSGSSPTFKKYNGIVYAFNSSGTASSTSDTSFASASWTSIPINVFQNTTDSAGYFSSSIIRKQGNGWISYGYVYSAQSGRYLPAKNISTDNGATFTTSFLVGVPNTSPFYAITKTHVMASCYDNTANLNVPYVSSDALNFVGYPGNNSTYFPGVLDDQKYFE